VNQRTGLLQSQNGLAFASFIRTYGKYSSPSYRRQRIMTVSAALAARGLVGTNAASPPVGNRTPPRSWKNSIVIVQYLYWFAPIVPRVFWFGKCGAWFSHGSKDSIL